MSHKNIRTTSVSRIFTRLKGKMPLDNENDIIEDIGDALEAIGSVNQYREAVCYMEVKNFTANVPRDSHAIIQLAKNNLYSPIKKTGGFTKDSAIKLLGAIRRPITTLDEEAIEDQCNCYLEEREDDCSPGYSPVFSLTYEFQNWTTSNVYRQAFTPVRLTNHSFFNDLVCKEDNYEEIYRSCRDEYNIIDGNVLRFNFKEGQVALAYHQIMRGEDGLPLIPDNISYITAIVNYCLWQHYTREFYSGREGAANKMQLAESEWIWYCGQANNKSMMIEGEDEHQNFLEQRSYMIPPRQKYFGFFGSLSKEERRRF